MVAVKSPRFFPSSYKRQRTRPMVFSLSRDRILVADTFCGETPSDDKL